MPYEVRFVQRHHCSNLCHLLQISCVAAKADQHNDDVECCIFLNHILYTGSDDGTIKVRAEPANPVHDNWTGLDP